MGRPSVPRDPVTKARILVALAEGSETYSAIARRFGVSSSVVAIYAKELKEKQGIDSIEARRERVLIGIENFICDVLSALAAQAQLLGDIDFLRKQMSTTEGTKDVMAHTRALTSEIERITLLQQTGAASAGPDALPERVEAEIVDE